MRYNQIIVLIAPDTACMVNINTFASQCLVLKENKWTILSLKCVKFEKQVFMTILT